MYEELCQAVGQERFDKINKLKLFDADVICHKIKTCSLCPFALHYTDDEDGRNIPLILCVDLASEKQIKKVLEKGGKFIKLEGV